MANDLGHLGDHIDGEPVVVWYPNPDEPGELEQVVDETIAMLVEKLAEAERELERANGIIDPAKQDGLRLRWLEERFDLSHISVSDAIFGNHDWTDIRKAIDAAMAQGI